MTLTQTAILTKRAIFTLILLLVVGTSTFIGYKIYQMRYLSSIPTPESRPDFKFGLLPKPDFKQSKVSSANFSYSIDTTTGGLPNFPSLAKVYFMPKGVVTFTSADKALALSVKLGFKNPPQTLTDTKYFFRDPDKTLEFELDSGKFLFQREATTAANSIPSGDEKQIVTEFKSLLQNLGLFNESLQGGNTKIKMLEGPKRVSSMVWPKPINEIPLISSDFSNSLIEGETTGSFDAIENLLSLKYTFWTIDESVFATYPLKTVSEALEDLKAAKGIIAVEPKSAQVSITSVYLAYIQSENYNFYLLPIFVFEGSNFVGLVSAIPNQYINQPK